MMLHPLLTIGIPTYNRAELLIRLLNLLCKELNHLSEKSKVEIIISDNSSTDSTEKVLQQFNFQDCNIKISRNPENIGANKNILKIGSELATGKYCWILGDDDMIRPGSVVKIVSVIESSKPDLIYLNQTYEYVNKGEINISKIDNKNILINYDSDIDGIKPEFLLHHSTKNAFFTSLPSLIFKRENWVSQDLVLNSNKIFDSLENTFPHSFLLAKSFINGNVYFISYPYLAFVVGAQDWFDKYWKVLKIIRVLDLANHFKNSGCSKKFYRNYVDRVFNGDNNFLFLITADPSIPFSNEFNIYKYIIKYKSFYSFWKWLAKNYYRIFLYILKKIFYI